MSINLSAYCAVVRQRDTQRYRHIHREIHK